MIPLDIRHHDIATPDGWLLSAKQTTCPERLDSTLAPLLIVPGYGMNAYIFGFHPRGTSLERCLAEQGFNVWSINLRGQAESRRTRSNAPGPNLLSYATEDIPATIDHVLQSSAGAHQRVDILGASLGGTIAYGYLAVMGEERVRALVAVGAPLVWNSLHPALRLVFGSRRAASLVRFRGTRALARAALPLLARSPKLLSIYMNTSIVDVSQAGDLTRTVEDPVPAVNRDIAEWIKQRDLVLRGVNVSHALQQCTIPLLIVLSNRDGIVPAPAALAAAELWGAPSEVKVLEVGDDVGWYAHADLFVSNPAPDTVFTPIASWLKNPRGG